MLQKTHLPYPHFSIHEIILCNMRYLNNLCSTESGDSSSDAGSIVGGLLTALLILSFIVTVILFYFSFKHKRKQKRIEKFQRDILTEYVHM